MLIKLQINEEIENTDGVLICKRFWEKLKRRLPKEAKFIRVLIYHKKNIPEYDFWVISSEPISIDQTIIKSFWEDGTKTAKVITPVTKEIIEKEAQYYKSNKTNHISHYEPRKTHILVADFFFFFHLCPFVRI